jgi:hypothetical protein
MPDHSKLAYTLIRGGKNLDAAANDTKQLWDKPDI